MKRQNAAALVLMSFAAGLVIGRTTTPAQTATTATQTAQTARTNQHRGAFEMALASSYVVSGAGDTGANGTYTVSASPGGINEYSNGADWAIRWGGTDWAIWNDNIGYIAYYGSGTTTEMATVWDVSMDGTAPAPTVSGPAVEIAQGASGNVSAAVTDYGMGYNSWAVWAPGEYGSGDALAEGSNGGSGSGWTGTFTGDPITLTVPSGATVGSGYTVEWQDGGSNRWRADFDVTAGASLPGTPSAPTFGSITATSLVVTLPSLPSGATSLKLQRSAHGAGSWSDRATGQSGGATVSETGLSASTQYDYRAVAVNGSGSTNGTSATATTLAAPSAPGVPTFSSVADTTLTVTLPSLPSNASSLRLQRRLNASGSWTTIASGLSGGATYNDSGLSASTLYGYRVEAVGNGTSQDGSEATVTTTAGPPATPEAPEITQDGARAALVTAVDFDGSWTGLSLRVWESQGAADSGLIDSDKGQLITMIDGTAARLVGLPTGRTMAAVLVASGEGDATAASELTTFTVTPVTSGARLVVEIGAALPTGVNSTRVIVEGAGDAADFTEETDSKTGGGRGFEIDLPDDGAGAFYCATVVCATGGGDREAGRFFFDGAGGVDIDETVFTPLYAENQRGVLVGGVPNYPTVTAAVVPTY